MIREDIFNNIRENYKKYDVNMDDIEGLIKSGESRGHSYSMIYTVIKKELSSAFDVREFFTPAELSECTGLPKRGIIQAIENKRKSILSSGGNPDEFAHKVKFQGETGYIFSPEFFH